MEVSSFKCPSCGAPVKGGEIPDWVRWVKCEYCGEMINVASNGASNKNTKSLDLGRFADFLRRKKGVSSFDPISGALSMDGNTVYVGSNGLVTGSGSLRRNAESWVNDYITSDPQST